MLVAPVIWLIFTVGHVVGQVDQNALDYIGRFLDFRFQVVDNLHNGSDTCQLLFNFTNVGRLIIPNGGWSIYFNKIRGIPDNQFDGGLRDQNVRLERIHGGLYRISPTRDFFAIRPAESRVIRFFGTFWMSARGDVMPNAYVTAPGLTPRIIENTRTETLDFGGTYGTPRQWKRDPFDRYNPMTTRERFERNRLDHDHGHAQDGVDWRRRIIPQPIRTEFEINRNITIDNSWGILATAEVINEANFVGAQLSLTRLTAERRRNVISLRVGAFDLTGVAGNIRLFNNSDAYSLTSDQSTNSVEIIGRGASGVFYGIQTLLMLLHGGRTIPQMRVMDAPRFEHRGMHLDVSRNFHRKAEVMRLLGAMSVYKMNKFHFHLSDDEGWRLEIPGLPELTQVGSQRCHDLSENNCLLPQLGSGPDTRTSGSGFYTVADYREILEFARQRHIEVIPEFDMPGHSRAAIRSMDFRLRNLNRRRRTLEARTFSLLDDRSFSTDPRQENFHTVAMNPCIDSTYRFIEHVVDAVVQMHRDISNLRVFHFGGDEVPRGSWNNSVACRALRTTDTIANVSLARYFANRVSQITARRNLELAGWEDGLMHEGEEVHERRELENREVYAFAWNNNWQWGHHNHSYILANAGYKVIQGQATHLYFDHPYEADPEERGLVWASRFTDTRKVFGFSPLNIYANMEVGWTGDPINRTEVCGRDGSYCTRLRRPENIIGIQGHLWTELVRTPDQLDYMIFPRLLAVAERAWHEAPWERLDPSPQRVLENERDWISFLMAVSEREIPRMEEASIRYRLPPPGARMNGRLLVTNNAYPGLPAQYRLQGTTNWEDVTPDLTLAANQTIFLRSRSHDRRRFSREIEFKTNPEPAVPVQVQSTVDYLAEFLQINLTIIENYNEENSWTCLMDMQLWNRGPEDIEVGNWQIYFNNMVQLFPPFLRHNPRGNILPEHGLRFTHVKGSLYRFEPVEGFATLRPNERRVVRLVIDTAIIAQSLTFPNWYVTAEGMEARVINSTRGNDTHFLAPFTNARQWKRAPEDRYDPYSLEQRYSINERVADQGGARGHIIPTPLEERIDESSTINLSECCWDVVTDLRFDREAQFLLDKLNLPTVRRAGVRSGARTIELRNGDPAVTLSRQLKTSPEAYQLTVDPQREIIEIRARDPVGAFYGVQSLLSLSRGQDGHYSGRVPRATIRDAPRYEHRGLSMEVVRNFRSKEEVMQVLEAMASYKMNKLHFHLSDDEGWRLEIPGLPELTEITGRQCHDLQEHTCLLPQFGQGPDNITGSSRFYTVQDYRDIIRFARDRHIEVIEEFDTPGHSRAAIIAMRERQRRLRELGDPTADDFLLSDPKDNAEYLSVQGYDDNMVNPCLEATYRFFRHVMQEVQRMRRDIAPMTNYFFVGGEVIDEFVNSTACRQRGLDRTGVRRLFAQRMSQIATDLRIELSGWADGFMGTDNEPIARIRNLRYAATWNNVWEWGQANWAHRLANAGYNVVLAHATHVYLDHPHEPDPQERGLPWAGRYTDIHKVFGYMPDDIYANLDNTVMGEPISREEFCRERDACLPLRNQQNIIGMEGAIWSETTRTAEQQQGLIFPRLLAVAERSWHKASWENITDGPIRERERDADFARFVNTLGYKELPFLDGLGIAYRIPPPGAQPQGWSWLVNVEFPHLMVEASFNGGATWHTVRNGRISSQNGAPPLFRTRSSQGNRYSRVVSSAVNNMSSASLLIYFVLAVILFQGL